MLRKINLVWNPTRITGTSHEDQYTFLISRSFLLRTRNVSDKCVEKVKTHILFSVTYFSPENRAVYEITWKNILEPGRPQVITRHMRIACSIPKAKNTHYEYVKLTAFLLQQWLYERFRLWLAFSFLPRPLYRRGSPRFPSNRVMDGPWSQYGRFREEKSVAPRLFLVRN